MELVIFSSVLSISAMMAALVLYAVYAVAVRFLGEKNIVLSIIAIVNFAVHVALFALCVYLKASMQEMLFVLMVSTALALTVTKHGKEEK